MTAAVRTFLVNQGIVSSSLTSGSNWVCLTGGLSDHVTAPQVALLVTAGLQAVMAHNSKGPDRPGLQILVRGLPGTYAVTAQKAEAIWEALHQASTGSLLLITGVNNPIWLGYDQQDRPQWSINFLTIRKRST